MITRLRQLLEMIRFSHTLFALPFALLAAVMAWSAPTIGRGDSVPFRWRDLFGVILCMVFARSAAMAFNRIADWRIDAENPRTAGRHLPAGTLSLRVVVLFTVANCLGFIVSTLIFWPNRLPIILSIPVLLIVLSYSYTKRFTSFAHFWLGLALMLAPVSAWIAIRGEAILADPRDLLPAVWLGAAVLLWVAGFDMIYACQDYEFDTHAHLRSVPVAIGISAALRLASVCHFGMVVLLMTLPWTSQLGGPALQLGWIFGTGVAAVTLLLIYEHWLVRPDDLTRVNRAFFHVNAIVSIGLFLVTSVDLLI